MKNIPELSDEELFFEWMDWFRTYRNEGELQGLEREYFKSLSKAMRDRKLVADSISTLSSWYSEVLS